MTTPEELAKRLADFRDGIEFPPEFQPTLLELQELTHTVNEGILGYHQHLHALAIAEKDATITELTAKVDALIAEAAAIAAMPTAAPYNPVEDRAELIVERDEARIKATEALADRDSARAQRDQLLVMMEALHQQISEMQATIDGVRKLVTPPVTPMVAP